jgi:unsaturated rhamnogalacturonyl hydrolase
MPEGNALDRWNVLRRTARVLFTALALIGLGMVVLIGYEVGSKAHRVLTAWHMGIFESREQWIKAMEATAVRQYEHPSAVGNLHFPRLVDQFDHKHMNYFYAWQTAGLILGLEQCMTPEAAAKVIGRRNNLTDLVGNEIDSAILAYALERAPTANIQQREQIVARVLTNVQSAMDKNTGTLMFRKALPSVRFVDTIGLAVPFVATIGNQQHDGALTQLAFRQLKEIEEHAFVDRFGYIPFHGFDLRSSTPLGAYGWGRGTGWYALGLIDTLPEVDDEKKAELSAAVVRLAIAVCKFQRNDGSWGSILNDANSHSDTSATALLLYFLKRACSLGVLNSGDYIRYIEAAERYLMANTRSDGVVTNSEEDAIGMGAYSSEYSPMPFTQGLTLRAVCQSVSAPI